MALDHYEIIDAYRYLKKIYSEITDQNIENYSDQLYRISANLKVMKKFINSSYETSFKDDAAKLYNKCEILYYKILFYSDLWASADWIKMTIDEYNDKGKHDDFVISIKSVNNFIEALLFGDNPVKYRNEIAKIVNGKMIPKALDTFYKSIRIRTDNFRSINEGFYNPFDDELLISDDEEIIDTPKVITPEEDKLIKKLKLYNNKSKIGGIQFKDGRVYASKTFYMDDIIETAPVRVLDDADLYSSNVRKLTFPIDLSKRIFGIPFGIGSIARSEIETDIPGNIDYEYDPDKANEIIIYAIRKINKGDELIFVNDNKMEIEKSFNRNYSHPDEIINISAKVKTIADI